MHDLGWEPIKWVFRVSVRFLWAVRLKKHAGAQGHSKQGLPARPPAKVASCGTLVQVCYQECMDGVHSSTTIGPTNGSEWTEECVVIVSCDGWHVPRWQSLDKFVENG